MSVLKNKRKASQFEVFRHLTSLRKDITDLLLRDFGYNKGKADKYLSKMFSGKPYDELTDAEKIHYDKTKRRNEAFHEWFIVEQRKVIIDSLREIQKNVYMANSIYPTYMEELIERRIHQDRAIGHCYNLVQELHYIIETLPVNINVYLRFADEIQTEIDLIKGWRKSDNKFLKKIKNSDNIIENEPILKELCTAIIRVISESASNFANVNNNGNANYNNASNSNGVRPDFKP